MTATTSTVFTMSFSDFCRDVYGFDFNEELAFYGTEPNNFEVEKGELEQAIVRYPGVDESELRYAIQRAKSASYEGSYTDEYREAARKLLKDKIEKDFSNLVGFFEEGCGEIVIEGKIPAIVDLEEDTIKFPDPDKLLICIINCINGVGQFYYESLAEFKEVNNHGTESEVIRNHIPWLKRLESIYDSYHNLFRIDVGEGLEYPSRRFGSSEYDFCNLEDYLELNRE